MNFPISLWMRKSEYKNVIIDEINMAKAAPITPRFISFIPKNCDGISIISKTMISTEFKMLMNDDTFVLEVALKWFMKVVDTTEKNIDRSITFSGNWNDISWEVHRFSIGAANIMVNTIKGESNIIRYLVM
jgi:hypothetical protein